MSRLQDTLPASQQSLPSMDLNSLINSEAWRVEKQSDNKHGSKRIPFVKSFGIPFSGWNSPYVKLQL